MAVIANQNQDEKDNNPQQTGAGVSAPQSRVASYSTGTPQTQGSGRFTNLQKYISANQGAGQQLGSKISGNIEKSAERTQKEATSAASNVANQIQAEKNRLAEGTQFNQQIQQDPTKITQDQAQSQRFSKLLQPQNVAGQLQQQTQQAQQQAQQQFQNIGQQLQNLGTEQGRFALLQQATKNPAYTQGQQRLDQLFLQAGNPNQLIQNQKALQKQLGASQTELEKQFTGLGTDITAAGKQAEDVAKMLSGTLGTETQNLTAAQQKEAQALNAERAVQNAAVETYFKQGYGTLTPEQKQIIDAYIPRFRMAQGTRTYNVLNDPDAYKKYVTFGNANLTSQDVLDTQELARYQALAGLAGTPKEQLAFTQAGNRGPNTGIDVSKLSTDIDAAKQNFINSLSKNAVASGTGNASIDAFSSDINAQAQANLQDLFNQYQQNQNVANLANIGQTFTGTERYSGGPGLTGYNQTVSTGSALSNASQTALAQANAQARQNLIQQFLDQLQTGGYNAGLGGVAPGNVKG